MDLADIWSGFPEILMFIAMIPCIAFSEATIERLFSFLHRSAGYFIRKSLGLDTLEHFANIYINRVLKIKSSFETKTKDQL